MTNDSSRPGATKRMAGFTTCPECEGSGEVHWNPSRIGDPQCVESANCPTCRGYGAVADEDFADALADLEERREGAW